MSKQGDIQSVLGVSAIFLFFPILFWGCAQPESRIQSSDNRPNILWIIGENAGPDLGCYGVSDVITPYLDRLSKEGVRYEHAFATSPVCSPSRSALMTGVYQTSIGAHNHRSHRIDFFPLPEGIQPLTHYLRKAGYYTANIRTMGRKRVGTGKTDLNFDVEGELLCELEGVVPQSPRDQDETHNQENEARLFHSDRWEDLHLHQPFYAQINLPVVELTARGWSGSQESPWYNTGHPSRIDPEKVSLPPYYPDHPVTRREWARYLDAVCGMDKRVGQILSWLESGGLADNTVVIFFTDNGRLTLRGLDWCYDSGDRVPLIIRWPKSVPRPSQYQPGSTETRLVSLIDVTATTLAIAGIPKPERIDGRVILGPETDPTREFVISARDRCDEAVNRIRSLRTSRYRYIRNFMPRKAFMALHRYKAARYPVMKLMFQLQAEGKLTPVQQQLMAERLPTEELYDLSSDPYEINNLASSEDSEHQRILRDFRDRLTRWIKRTGDQGQYPESSAVIEYWTRVMDEQYGIPQWYSFPQ